MISTINKANSFAYSLRIVIPFDICKELGLKKGMKMKWEIRDNKEEIVLRKATEQEILNESS